MNSDDRIQDLEAKVAELTALVEQMTALPSAAPASALIETTAVETTAVEASEAESTAVEAPRTASRRGMLKLAGAAAAGAVVATANQVMPAAALDGNPLNMSETATTTAATTLPTAGAYANTAVPLSPGFFSSSPANLFVFRDNSGFFLANNNASSFPAALAGYSYRTVANGIYGYTAMGGAGVVAFGAGTGSTGLFAQGDRSNIELKAVGTAPSARADAHVLGEVVCDTAGDVWICTVAGTPGTWRKVAGAATAGAFHALSPGRVYDSRAAAPLQGSIAGGQNRTISVADKRDTVTGAVTTANFVPAGAVAVTANITVSGTIGAGFLTVNPGGSTVVDSSTINWSGTGQILANGVTLTLSPLRQLTVVAGGGGSTDFVVDISGYYL
jgi:hypothetical protein